MTRNLLLDDLSIMYVKDAGGGAALARFEGAARVIDAGMSAHP